MCLIFGMPCLLWRWVRAPSLYLSRQVTPGAAEKPGQRSGWRLPPLALDSRAEARDKLAGGGLSTMNLLRPIDRTFTVNGLRLHLLDWGGEGRTPLLLLHGFTGHAHAWDTLSIALQPHFHVYALDQRGHGDSDPADVYNAIAAFDDINGVIGELGITSLVLRGESSTVLERDVAERMAKELPRRRFVEIPRAVHTLHEDNPEAVLAALKEFLGF